MPKQPPAVLTHLSSMHESGRIAFTEQLSGAPKAQAVAQYLLEIINNQAPYSHREAITTLYGSFDDQKEYRKTYQAYVKQLGELDTRLEEFVSGKYEEGANELIDLSDGERHYYIGRAFYKKSQLESATIHFAKAWEMIQRSGGDEHIRLAAAASLSLCLHQLNRIGELPTEIAADPMSVVRDTFVTNAWVSMHLVNTVASISANRDLAPEYGKLIDGLVNISVMHNRIPALELLRAWFDKADSQWRQDAKAEADASARVIKYRNIAVAYGYSFISAEDGDSESAVEHMLVEFDSLRTQGDVEGALAMIRKAYTQMDEFHPNYEFNANTYTSFLLSASFPAELSIAVPEFLTFLRVKKFDFYIAVQEFFLTLNHIQTSDQVDEKASLATIANLEKHIGDTRRGLAAILRARALLFHRVADYTALSSVYQQLVRMRGSESDVVLVRSLVRLLKYDMDNKLRGEHTHGRIQKLLTEYLDFTPDNWANRLFPMCYLALHCQSTPLKHQFENLVLPALADARFTNAMNRVREFICR